MAFLRRFLSGDFRRALAAEAAGDYADAARHYALAGERDKVAEMHLLRGERATTAVETEAALRDALRWTDAGTPDRCRVARELGTTLVRRARSEGATTARDRERLREAVGLFEEAGELREAGRLWEQLGEDEAAAHAYERGGYLDEMEAALFRERERRRQTDRLRSAFATYESELRNGRRDAALHALSECIKAADAKGEYVRLFEELSTRRLAEGRVELVRRLDARRVVFATGVVTLGRDPDSTLVLRAAGISRTHARIDVGTEGFAIADAGSKHGTWLADLPLANQTNGVPLVATGRLRLGADCEIEFTAASGHLALEIARGLDRGARLLVGRPNSPIDLGAPLGLAGLLHFETARPFLTAENIALNGAVVAGPIQLVRGDTVAFGGVELDVL